MSVSDRDRLTKLVNENATSWIVLAHSYLGDSNAAEDAVAEVVLKVCNKRFDHYRYYKAAIRRAIVNQCLTILRRRKVEKRKVEKKYRQAEAESNDSDRETRIDAGDAELQDAIDQLPENDATVIRLKYFELADYEQIAKRLGVSVRTAKRYRERAIARLRSILGDSLAKEAAR